LTPAEAEAGRPDVVAPVGAADRRRLVDVLVRAFAEDPVAGFVFPSARRRHAGLRRFFSAQVRRQYGPLGFVRTTRGLDGAALWGPPDRPGNSLRQLVQLLPVVPHLVARDTAAVLRFLSEVDRHHPRAPHWYLATLGTAPERQGRGIGSALLAEGLARIDAAGEPAYLESSKERNVPFYARFGFDVIEELRLGAGTPPMWLMWREPRAPSG
jgi:ribosomal protein S18 acetylase RimI-like enzyme